MAKKLHQIIVVDVEATCWEGKNPEGQPNEIIEIGICILDVKTLERVGKEGMMVKPQLSQISPFCTELTTITPADVANGLSLREAGEILRTKYKSKSCTWASYGDYDRRQFERECIAKEIAYPFGTAHINVKNLLALTKAWNREIGMAGALEKLKLPLEGTHHRGVDDAWNIAAILAAIFKMTR